MRKGKGQLHPTHKASPFLLTDEITVSILHRASCGSESVCLSVFQKSIITK